jgi:hypothetical protein
MFNDLSTYMPKKTTDSTCSSSPDASNDNISSTDSSPHKKAVAVLSTTFNQQHQNPEDLDSSFFGNGHESSFPVSNERKFKSYVLIENESQDKLSIDLEGSDEHTNDETHNISNSDIVSESEKTLTFEPISQNQSSNNSRRNSITLADSEINMQD